MAFHISPLPFGKVAESVLVVLPALNWQNFYLFVKGRCYIEVDAKNHKENEDDEDVPRVVWTCALVKIPGPYKSQVDSKAKNKAPERQLHVRKRRLQYECRP